MPTLPPPAAPTEPARRPRPRPWGDKFRDALRGLKCGVRGKASFAVHFFFAVLSVIAASVFGCAAVEWCLLLGCIGLVLTAELFHCAVEALYRGLDEEARARAGRCP